MAEADYTFKKGTVRQAGEWMILGCEHMCLICASTSRPTREDGVCENCVEFVDDVESGS